MTIQERIKAAWEKLNACGIYTEEQLDKAIKDNPLDIGIFTMPYKQEKVKKPVA